MYHHCAWLGYGRILICFCPHGGSSSFGIIHYLLAVVQNIVVGTQRDNKFSAAHAWIRKYWCCQRESSRRSHVLISSRSLRAVPRRVSFRQRVSTVSSTLFDGSLWQQLHLVRFGKTTTARKHRCRCCSRPFRGVVCNGEPSETQIATNLQTCRQEGQIWGKHHRTCPTFASMWSSDLPVLTLWAHADSRTPSTPVLAGAPESVARCFCLHVES